MERSTQLTDEQLNALHQVYAFLIELADMEDAADQDEFGDLARPAAKEDAPTKEAPSAVECSAGNALAQVEEGENE